MFRLGSRATASLCIAELASRTFIRGARTRAAAAPTRKAKAAAASNAGPSRASNASVQPQGIQTESTLLSRSPVYVQIAHLIPPPEGTEPQVAELNPVVFDAPIRRDILHLCVVQHLDNKRQGSANTKTRGEVRGSGRKIRPQKGTGRARLGDGQSPMLRGGGVAFGPKPRDFSTKLPRKVRAMGMRVALSSRVREESILIVDSFDWPGVKTKEFKLRMQRLRWGRCLFVVGRGDETFNRVRRVSRVEGIHLIKVQDLDIHTLLRWPKLVLDPEAVEWLEAKWHPNAWVKDPITFPSSPSALKGWNIPPPSQSAEPQVVVSV